MYTHFILVPCIGSLAGGRFSSDHFEPFGRKGMWASQLDACLFSNTFYLVTNAFKRCKVCTGEFYSSCLRHYLSSTYFLLRSYLSVMSSTTPAPIVVPISRRANLPISGKSLKVSIASGLTGLILTIAASPVLRNFGFCSVVAPVLGSILETNCEIVAATCAVCACKTGVYPGAIAVGWWITIRRASNSLATDGGLAAAPLMSPRLICFLSTPLRLKPTLSPASADSS